jgi:cation transport ATPase
VPKRAGDALIGGSVNTASPLVMRVERVGEATRLAAIQRLMERAAAEKPRLVEMADRVAGALHRCPAGAGGGDALWPGGGSIRRAPCGYSSPCWW